jgi:hypothetical protein
MKRWRKKWRSDCSRNLSETENRKRFLVVVLISNNQIQIASKKGKCRYRLNILFISVLQSRPSRRK